ncbi:uncharacterized protein LOC100372025 [Saccoglossus kowalevskii]|uniref:Uncharacterized protein LOC100372025 n=1 Tax=Saccoglossus kowalevskii TaxID=10224 RepID=A0ABM0GS39_SACKO|nr:PREDICTED: uncharacterized protein LOC100372025 [Saccoglossus kowalevskii]
MNSLTLITLCGIIACAFAASAEVRRDFAIKKAMYDDILVRTIDRIMKRGTCTTTIQDEEGNDVQAAYNPCGTGQYCYSNDDESDKYACTDDANDPCGDANACPSGTCTANADGTGFTCQAAKSLKSERGMKLEALLDKMNL